MLQIKRALVSVSNKAGLIDLARELSNLGVEIISTGGTAKAISQAGLEVVEVAEVTGFPEMLDGRLKTLHPKIHGAILARRDLETHIEELARAGITPIDLVVVNLYPFQEAVAESSCTLEKAIENIDIGGPTMIRAAAKNYSWTAVLVDPADYKPFLDELKATGGAVSRPTRWRLAKKAFTVTSAYDRAIVQSLPRWDSREAR